MTGAAALIGAHLNAGCTPGSPASSLYLPVWIDTAGGSGADGVVIADIDADGDLDAVSAWEGSGRVRLHLQQADHTWGNLTIADSAAVAGVEDVAVGDLDLDGRLDVVAACESGRVTWIRQGEDALTWYPDVIDVSHNVGCSSWIDVEVGDVDGDGRLEIVAACKGGGWVSIFYTLEPPTAGSSFLRFDVDTTTRRKASCVRLIDLDGDGNADIVSVAREEEQNSIAWYENPGAEAWRTQAWTKHGIGQWPDAFWLDLGDIDGDGRIDLAVSSWREASFGWFRQPDDVRTAWTGFAAARLSGTHGAGVTIADLDGDGRVEVVVGTYRNGQLAVLRPLNDPTGGWLTLPLARPGGALDLVPVVDLDADGRLDIITTVSGDGGGVVWYRAWQ
ncbi:MAG TPA: VCBS repeat-containing protein [Phycisphaerae bacterium]|nr:VCBS repeat-containing protein [Phycisphaerae bacterium]HNU44068.1 VCBS repeat-containing protein [Phycisphaerae bacterium]